MKNHIPTEQFSLALDNQLAQAQSNAMHEHLKNCIPCKIEWELWQVMSKRLKSAPLTSPSAGFAQRFETRRRRQDALRKSMLGGSAVLIGSVIAWTLLALFFATIVIIWISSAPNGTSLFVQTAVGFAQAIQPFAETIQSALGGLVRVPPQIIFFAVGLGMLCMTFGWAQLVKNQRVGTSQHIA